MELRIQVDAKAVIIPDLWFIARGLGLDTPEGKAVLATWHLAYDLKRALADAQREG
jgi:hypothetical protein